MDGNDFGLMQAFDHASSRTLRIDVEHYQYLLDSTDLTDAQKREVLEALWTIIVTVVELGYGVHPLQEVCGQSDNLSDEWSAASEDALNSEHTTTEEDREDTPKAE